MVSAERERNKGIKRAYWTQGWMRSLYHSGKTVDLRTRVLLAIRLGMKNGVSNSETASLGRVRTGGIVHSIRCRLYQAHTCTATRRKVSLRPKKRRHAASLLRSASPHACRSSGRSQLLSLLKERESTYMNPSHSNSFSKSAHAFSSPHCCGKPLNMKSK
jgi:hypothetical protein